MKPEDIHAAAAATFTDLGLRVAISDPNTTRGLWAACMDEIEDRAQRRENARRYAEAVEAFQCSTS